MLVFGEMLEILSSQHNEHPILDHPVAVLAEGMEKGSFFAIIHKLCQLLQILIDQEI